MACEVIVITAVPEGGATTITHTTTWVFSDFAIAYARVCLFLGRRRGRLRWRYSRGSSSRAGSCRNNRTLVCVVGTTPVVVIAAIIARTACSDGGGEEKVTITTTTTTTTTTTAFAHARAFVYIVVTTVLISS